LASPSRGKETIYDSAVSDAAKAVVVPMPTNVENVSRTASSPDIPRLKSFFIRFVLLLGTKKAPYFYDASSENMEL
jgi:hypothetical protein